MSACPPLGAHMSIAGGLYRAVERARKVDATALQIFVTSARQWAMRRLEAGEGARFRDAVAEAGLGRALMAHASYLINLASPRPALRERSIRALRRELDRCALLGVPYLVLHPGSHDGAGTEAGLRRVARSVDRALEGREGVTLLLENTAGQGNTLGASFDELAWLLSTSRHGDRLGICFDTCHALAAGHDFRDAASFGRLLAELERTVGVDRILAFHLNDSKHELGSRRDRHEHVGRGRIGLDGFRLLLNEPRFASRPMVLETPKGESSELDRTNLATLRALVGRRR